LGVWKNLCRNFYPVNSKERLNKAEFIFKISIEMAFSILAINQAGSSNRMKHVLGHLGDVSGFHALNAVSKFKSDGVALADMQNVIGVYVGNVDIYVLSVFSLDMTIASLGIKPLDGSCEHGRPPFENQNGEFFSAEYTAIRFDNRYLYPYFSGVCP
jgi:hypothetical protein